MSSLLLKESSFIGNSYSKNLILRIIVQNKQETKDK